MKRKILIVAICYVIGTVGGLYFNKNIIPFLCLILLMCLLIFKRKFCGIIIFSAIFISCILAQIRASYISKFYKLDDDVEVQGIVISVSEGDYYKKCELKVDTINQNKVKWGFKIYAYIKNDKCNVQESDYLHVLGSFSSIQESRNYGGFNQKRYLQSKNVVGIIKTDKYSAENKDKGLLLYVRIQIIKFFANLRTVIKTFFYKYLPKENANLCIALLLGEKLDVDASIIQNFSDGGMSHILAISGMHVAYVATLVAFLSKKLVGKQKSNYLVIISIIFFCILAHNSESVFRATVMLCLYYLSKILHRKSDSLTNLSVSIILSLIINPFCIFNTSFVMSSMGTLGIISFYKYINNKEINIAGNKSNEISENNEKENKDIDNSKTQNISKNKLKIKFVSYIKSQINLGLSANLALFPITIMYFNKLSLIFILSSPFINLALSILMPALILYTICGILSSIVKILPIKITSVFVNFLSSVLIKLAELFSKVKILNFLVATPKIYTVTLYYILIFIWLLKLSQNKFFEKAKKIGKLLFIVYLAICVINGAIGFFDNSMKIYFVDQTTPNMIQRISEIFERKPLISKEI